MTTFISLTPQQKQHPSVCTSNTNNFDKSNEPLDENNRMTSKELTTTTTASTVPTTSSVSDMTEMVQRISTTLIDNTTTLIDNSCSWGDDEGEGEENGNDMKHTSLDNIAENKDTITASKKKVTSSTSTDSVAAKRQEAGIVRHTFSRNDVMRIRQHWEDDDNNSDEYDSNDETTFYAQKVKSNNDLLLPSQRYKAFLNHAKYYDAKFYDEDDLILMQAQIEAAKKLQYERRQQQQQLQGPGITRRVFDYGLSTAKGWWNTQYDQEEQEHHHRRASNQQQQQRPRQQQPSLSYSSSSPSSATSPNPNTNNNKSKIPTSPTQLNMEERNPKAKQYTNDDLITSITIEPEKTSVPNILTQSMMLQIAQCGLPTSIAFSKWVRLYSLLRDGDSFSTMLRKVQKQKQTLLVVKTTNEDIFGGFADSPWEAQHQHSIGHAFYGSAQAFLFQLSREDTILVYKWTGKNRYIQFCDTSRKLIAMGGGGKDGNFGFCVEDDFRRGSTGACDTFDNQCLVSSSSSSKETTDARFNILDLEVWGFSAGF